MEDEEEKKDHLPHVSRFMNVTDRGADRLAVLLFYFILCLLF